VQAVSGEGQTLSINYRQDDPKGKRSFKILDDGQTFVAPDGIDLAFADFNPLQFAVTTSETLVADENFDGVKKFLDALLGLGKVVVPNKTAADAVTKLQESMSKMSKTGENKCKGYNELRDVLKKLQEDTEAKEVTKADVQGWIDGSTGLPGVKATRKKIQDASAEVNGIIAGLETLLKQLDNIAHPKNEEQECTQFVASTFAQVYELGGQVPRAQQALASMKKALDGLDKGLEPFTAPTKWRGSTQSTWILRKISPSFKNGKEIKIGIRKTELALEGDALTVKTKAEATRTFTLRQLSRFVPELAAAVIYSDVAYPKWGTAQEEGVTVVRPAKDEKATVDGALMLNLICRCWGKSVVYPAFQLGISSAKDVPGLLAGIGLRFTQPTSFSLMAGRMLTWAKDLDGLNSGDPVSGTAEVESHLKLKRQPTAYYIALQYNF
jgi:hypothetical protein